MIKISKEERFTLEKDYKLKFNRDIFGTFSKARKYYLVETQENLNKLNQIRHKK